jgi:hypothetical protein
MVPRGKRSRARCVGKCGGGFRAGFVRLAAEISLCERISLRTGSARNGGARFVAFVGGNEMIGFLLIKLTCGASQLYSEMNSAFSIFWRNDLNSRIVYHDALSSRT